MEYNQGENWLEIYSLWKNELVSLKDLEKTFGVSQGYLSNVFSGLVFLEREVKVQKVIEKANYLSSIDFYGNIIPELCGFKSEPLRFKIMISSTSQTLWYKPNGVRKVIHGRKFLHEFLLKQEKKKVVRELKRLNGIKKKIEHGILDPLKGELSFKRNQLKQINLLLKLKKP